MTLQVNFDYPATSIAYLTIIGYYSLLVMSQAGQCCWPICALPGRQNTGMIRKSTCDCFASSGWRHSAATNFKVGSAILA